MGLDICEQLTAASRGFDSVGEDRLVRTDAFAAIIDGSSPKTSSPAPLYTGGTVAATIESALHDVSVNSTATEAVTILQSAVRRTRLSLQHDDVIPTDELPAATFIIYSMARREVWRVGDTSFAFYGPSGLVSDHSMTRTEIDRVAASTRATYLRCLIAGGAQVNDLRAADPGRVLILPLLRAAHHFRNRTDDRLGYGALDGMTDCTPFIEVIGVPRDAAELVMTSDGYLRPDPSLDAAEARLRARIARDPLFVDDPPETKGVVEGEASFDDRTYLRMSIS